MDFYTLNLPRDSGICISKLKYYEVHVHYFQAHYCLKPLLIIGLLYIWSYSKLNGMLRKHINIAKHIFLINQVGFCFIFLHVNYGTQIYIKMQIPFVQIKPKHWWIIHHYVFIIKLNAYSLQNMESLLVFTLTWNIFKHISSSS